MSCHPVPRAALAQRYAFELTQAETARQDIAKQEQLLEAAKARLASAEQRADELFRQLVLPVSPAAHAGVAANPNSV
jgi:hypothetical protein